MGRWAPGVELLGQVELFKELPKKHRQVILDHMKEMRFSPGQVVVQEGDDEGRFYLVTEGTARSVVSGQEGSAITTGDYFGEIALIDHGPRTATVVAETELRTLTIASFNFRSFLIDHPALCHKLLVRVCRILRAEREMRAAPASEPG